MPTPALPPVRVPRALRPGDRVAVVSPCGPVLDHRLLDAGLDLLRAWDLDVVEGAHTRGRVGHLAGTDDNRVSDLNAALADPAVRAVWIARGGYGLTRILGRVDWSALAADPTVIVGFSDATALLLAARQRVGVVGVHGPFVGRLAMYPAAVVDRVRGLAFGQPAAPTVHGRMLSPGPVATGPLVGGNLAVLSALAGTPDRLRGAGCVVALEEVAEAPYRVDRMLTQLRDSGAFEGVSGVAVGTPVGCDPSPDRPSATFDEVVAERLGGLGVPVVADLPIGHVRDQWGLLHGATATVDASAGTFTVRGRLHAAHAG